MCNLNDIIRRTMSGFVNRDASRISYDGINVAVDEERFFDNKAKEYKRNNEYLDATEGNFSDKYLSRLCEYRNRLLNKLIDKLKDSENYLLKEDITVYTGMSGIAMLYLKIASEGKTDLNLEEKAMQYLTSACNNEKYKSKMMGGIIFNV